MLSMPRAGAQFRGSTARGSSFVRDTCGSGQEAVLSEIRVARDGKFCCQRNVWQKTGSSFVKDTCGREQGALLSEIRAKHYNDPQFCLP
jgi:hypothetical protein